MMDQITQKLLNNVECALLSEVQKLSNEDLNRLYTHFKVYDMQSLINQILNLKYK